DPPPDLGVGARTCRARPRAHVVERQPLERDQLSVTSNLREETPGLADASFGVTVRPHDEHAFRTDPSSERSEHAERRDVRRVEIVGEERQRSLLAQLAETPASALELPEALVCLDDDAILCRAKRVVSAEGLEDLRPRLEGRRAARLPGATPSQPEAGRR